MVTVQTPGTSKKKFPNNVFIENVTRLTDRGQYCSSYMKVYSRILRFPTKGNMKHAHMQFSFIHKRRQLLKASGIKLYKVLNNNKKALLVSSCWLSVTNGVIYAFVGPALAIILVSDNVCMQGVCWCYRGLPFTTTTTNNCCQFLVDFNLKS